MAPFKLILTVCFACTLAACQSSVEDAQDKSVLPNNSAATTLLSLLGNDGSLGDAFESAEAIRVAQSYPAPKLPEKNTPFEVQPDARFDQWSISSMVQDPVSNAWRWTRQEFFRVAIVEKDAPPSLSKWGFTDIIGQRYTHHDFGSGERATDISAERVAMTLATVTKEVLSLHNVSLTIKNQGCQSSLTLQRDEESMLWQTVTCPERFLVNDAVVESTRTVLPNGTRWISHTYGQLPTGTGAVIIDRIQVMMPDGDTLNINRSRRRSGSGPTTVAATLNGESLKGVEWEQSASDGALFPQEITVTVPSLSEVFRVSVPNAINNETFVSDVGAQHGVTIATDSSHDSTLAGVVFLHPASKPGL